MACLESDPVFAAAEAKLNAAGDDPKALERAWIEAAMLIFKDRSTWKTIGGQRIGTLKLEELSVRAEGRPDGRYDVSIDLEGVRSIRFTARFQVGGNPDA